MSDIRIVRRYPHPPAKVWRALTEPHLMALWGMRPEGFAPVVGTRFKFIGEPNPAWRGFIECEVLEVRVPSRLSYAWVSDGRGRPTRVTYTLEPHAGGSELTVEHTGFTGVRGFLLARLIMGPGWTKTLKTSFPAVLSQIDAEEKLRTASSLAAKH